MQAQYEHADNCASGAVNPEQVAAPIHARSLLARGLWRGGHAGVAITIVVALIWSARVMGTSGCSVVLWLRMS